MRVSYPRRRLCVPTLANRRYLPPLSTRGLRVLSARSGQSLHKGASLARSSVTSSPSYFSAAGVESSRATLSGRWYAVFIWQVVKELAWGRLRCVAELME